jgi:hypothetical protein
MAAAVFVTVLARAALCFSCDSWGTLPPVQELARSWVLPTGFLAIVAFAMGARAAGVALFGALLGAMLGELVGAFVLSRPLLGSALGASVTAWAVGIHGLAASRSNEVIMSAGARWALRLAAPVIVAVAILVAWTLPKTVAAADPACRAPAFGGFCHRHFIAWLVVADAVFLAFLLLVSARRWTSPQREPVS